MAVKGSKNTKERATETKAGMMSKDSASEKSNQNSESETSENLPKTSKEKAETRDTEKPLH